MLNIVVFRLHLQHVLNTGPVQAEIWICYDLSRFPISVQQVCQTFALALAEMKHVFINSARVSERNRETRRLPTPGNADPSREQRTEFTN